MVGVFPDKDSCLLLVTVRAKAQQQAWYQRRYLTTDLLKEQDLEVARAELATVGTTLMRANDTQDFTCATPIS